MIFCIDFDGTVIEQPKSPGDPAEDMQLRPGAARVLLALRQAGHILVLSSARSNPAHRLDWRLNPLWTSGAVPFDERAWERSQPFWEAAHQLMLKFIDTYLPDVFHAVDEGQQGKVVADVYLDDRGFRMGRRSWAEVEMLYAQTSKEKQRGQS